MHIRAIVVIDGSQSDFEKEMVLVVRITIRRIKFTASNRPRIERKGSRLCNLWCVRAAGNGFEWEAFAIDFWNERFFFLPFPPPSLDFILMTRSIKHECRWMFRCDVSTFWWIVNYCLKFIVENTSCFQRIVFEFKQLLFDDIIRFCCILQEY